MRQAYVSGEAIDAALALDTYIYRYTGDHTPSWVASAPKGMVPKVQYASDAEWLATVKFPVDSEGKLLVGMPVIGVPTFPDVVKVEKKAEAVIINESIASRM